MKEYEKYTVAMKIYSCLEHEDTVGNFTPFDYQTARLTLEELVDRVCPKKPDYEADGYSDGHLVYDTWICPRCGKDYEVEYDDYDYCPNCGQALDWSDEDVD